MTTTVWLLLSAMALLLSAGIVLWKGAQIAARRKVAQAFVSAQVDRQVSGSASSSFNTDDDSPGARRLPTGPRSWRDFMVRAGVTPGGRFYGAHAAWLLAAVGGGALLGSIPLVILPISALVLAFFRLWLKTERRRRDMVRQIPDFLDRVVRLMTVGQSIGAAFHQSVEATAAPLNEAMARVASLHRSGRDLDHCLQHVSRLYGLQELYLVAAVVGVALRFGGRSDQVLERMAAFIRDLEQARAEMSAMSAELRMSAWVLALLPMGMACFILIFNNALFMGMWNDEMGFRLLITAAVMQITGAYWLYRLAKSI